MVYFLNKIARKFGYKIIKIKQAEKMKKEKMNKEKMNANMIAVRNAMIRLNARNEKLTVENVAKEASVAWNTAKKYMYIV